MAEEVDFIVVGAGVVGLTVAIALKQRGYAVTVLEAGLFEVPLVESSRLYALNQGSQTLFQSLGVWDNLAQAQMAAYERMYIWDALGQAAIDFDARMVARDCLGVMIEESTLKLALLQQARALDIELVANWQSQVVDVQASEILLRSAIDTRSAAWLIVADGGRSSTRDLLGVAMTTWPYHQQAIVAKVSTEKPHERTAYQVFSPQGPLAFLPMAEANLCSVVWSTATAHAADLMALAPAAFEQQLAQSFEYTLGKVTLESPRKVFPLQMQHVKQYIGSRWVLMGDAAHTIHPLAGLGLNVGLADVTAFLRALPTGDRCMPQARAMQAYQRQRKHALWQLILFLQGMHVLFTHSEFPVKLARRVGLTICQRLPWVKRLFIEHAMGE